MTLRSRELYQYDGPENVVLSFAQEGLTVGIDGRAKPVSRVSEGTQDRTAERLRTLGRIIKRQGGEFLVDTHWRESGQDPTEFRGGTRHGTKNWLRSLKTAEGERLILEQKIQNRNVMNVNPKFRLLPDLALAQTLEVLYADVGKNWGEL